MPISTTKSGVTKTDPLLDIKITASPVGPSTLFDALDQLSKASNTCGVSAKELGDALSKLNSCCTSTSCVSGYSTGGKVSNLTNTVATDHVTIGSSGLYWGDSTTTAIPNINIDPITVTVPSFVTKEEMEKQMKDLHQDLDKFMNDYAAQNAAKEQPKNMNMKDLFGQFGPVTDGSIALSIKGMAIKNPSGKYVAYDEEKEEMYDVDIMHFDVKTPIFYRIPVSISDVCMGDIIVHNNHYCYVVDGDGKQFTVIDINMSEQRTILPQKSPFGFNYVTKVISLIKPGAASGETPFGNMLPFMMLSGSMESNDILPFLLMGQGQMDTSNPMMMYFLMKSCGTDNDILPFLLMQSNVLK
jgi:hypothetical protein